MQQLVKPSHGKREKSGDKNGIKLMNVAEDICKYFFNVKYGTGESPYSYRQIRRLQLTAQLY